MMELDKDAFSQKQWNIITSNVDYKQVIAAAGSGKTRTVIGYTLYSLQKNQQEQILILTFSRKACGELLNRFPKNYKDYIEIKTFHAFCYHYIKQYHPYYSKIPFNILLDIQKEKFLKELLIKKPEITYGIPYPVLIESFNQLQFYLPSLYKYIFEQIKKFKEENHYLEFEDLIELTLEGIIKNEKWILPLKEKYKHIVVDEFQDTDPKQMKFLTLLKPQKIFIVGDDWQSIYGFRGADLRSFLEFKSFFYKTKIFKLDENYRSLEPIVKTGNSIIKKSSKKIIKKVISIRGNLLNIPVLGYYLDFYKNYDFIIKIIIQYKGMLLVRSNYRKNFWLKKGLNSEYIMTIHKSKGLEFPFVIIDLSRGWSGESFLTDEEIRILYVAITRAQNLCLVLINTEIPTLETFIYKKLLKNHLKIVNDKELLIFLDKEFEFRHKLAS